MRTTQPLAANIRTSSFLSSLPLIGLEEEDMVQRVAPLDVLSLLQEAGVDCVLAGTHGIGVWMKETRATQDVDFVIREKDLRRAAAALLAAHPDWGIEKHPDVWRFTSQGEYVVDLMLARAPQFKRVLKEFEVVSLGRHKVKIPRVEAALAMKFAAMTGHCRKPSKKLLDAHEFMEIVEAQPAINVELLAEIGELVYAGGGADAVRYVTDVKAGRKLEI
jgi:hypothetical protein